MGKMKSILTVITALSMLCVNLSGVKVFAAASTTGIVFDEISAESPNAVTKNLTLPQALDDNTAITWISSDEIISVNGSVTRPATTDKKVVLSALAKDVSKSFEITVPASSVTVGHSVGYNSEESINNLKIENNAGVWDDAEKSLSAGNVKMTINQGAARLTQTGTNRSRVSGGDSTALSGMVVLEKRMKFSKGYGWYIKAADGTNLWTIMGYNNLVVTPYIGAELTISNYIYPAGYFTLKAVINTANLSSPCLTLYINDKPVEGAEEIPCGTARRTIAANNDMLEVYPREAGNTLDIDYSSVKVYSAAALEMAVCETLVTNDLLGANKAAIAITENLSLPKQINGTAITWESSASSAITNDGAVTRTAKNEHVTLTASIGASGEKKFSFVVLGTDIQSVVDSSDYYLYGGNRGFTAHDGDAVKVGNSGFSGKSTDYAGLISGKYMIETKFKFEQPVSNKASRLVTRFTSDSHDGSNYYGIITYITLSADSKLSINANGYDIIASESGLADFGEYHTLRWEIDTDLDLFNLFLDDVKLNIFPFGFLNSQTNFFNRINFLAESGTYETHAYIDNFLYARSDFEIKGLSYGASFNVKENGNNVYAINDIASATVYTDAYICNPNQMTEKIMLVAASYENDSLHDVVIKEITLSGQVYESIAFDSALKVPQNKKYAKIKCLIWTPDDMAPIQEAYTLR